MIEINNIANVPNNEYRLNRPKSLIVKSLDLLYTLSKNGMLHKLCGVAQSKFDATKRVFFFEPDEIVEKIISEHIENRRKLRAEREAFQNVGEKIDD